MPLDVGDEIEGYLIEGRLGVGGFGDTYRARSNANKIVAIKQIRDTHHSDAIEEARRLCDVDVHPNLANMLHVIDDEFLVMEFVRGRTLAVTLARRGTFDTERWWHYFRGLLEGVSYLHSCGLVHQDIKPDNIIVSGPRCVLIDFGGVRKAGCEATLVATPSYAPPEYRNSRGVGMPERSWDIYSLAVVSYKALYGCVEDPDVMIQHLTNSAIDYLKAVADGLKKDPNDRPPTVVNWVCRMVAPKTSRPDEALDSIRSEPETSGRTSMASVSDRSEEATPSGLGSDKDSNSWDARTLAELRDRIVTDFDLPRRSIAFLSKRKKQLGFQTIVRTLCAGWTGRAQLDTPRSTRPKNRFKTKPVASLRTKVEDVYGLPSGSITVLKPNRSRYSKSVQVSQVLLDYDA